MTVLEALLHARANGVDVVFFPCGCMDFPHREDIDERTLYAWVDFLTPFLDDARALYSEHTSVGSASEVFAAALALVQPSTSKKALNNGGKTVEKTQR